MVKEYIFESIEVRRAEHSESYIEWSSVTTNIEFLMNRAFQCGLGLVSSKVSNKAKLWSVKFRGEPEQHEEYVLSLPTEIYKLYNITIKIVRK